MAEKGMHEGHRERMRERYRQTGDLSGFAEHEVLEMLLFYIIPRVNTNDLAHSLLRHFGNIKCVLTADAASLCQVEGMTMKRAEQLRFLGQVLRLAEKESYLNVMADDVNSLRDYLTEFYRGETVERLCIFSVSSSGRITGSAVLGTGTESKVRFSPSELMNFLAGCDTEAVLLAHNHPFGSPEPSQDDMLLTRLIQNRLGEVRLMDHVIVSGNEMVSLRALGCVRAFE